MKNVPKENIKIFCSIYCIETAIRELIIESLEKKFGSKWYKHRLPSDILEKYKNGLERERKIKFTSLIPHHPIYYIDFSDLKKIILRQDNWRDGFINIFKNKDIINSALSELDCIRNKVAHNRKVSIEDLKIVEGSLIKISKLIGYNKFNNLTLRCTTSIDIIERIKELKNESKEAFNSCKKFKKIDELKKWNLIGNEWWFDETYLNCSLNNIKNFFNTIQEYINLPKVRGSGHIIEKWVNNSKINEKYKLAQDEFILIYEKL